MKTRIIGVNEIGRRIGEDHHLAVLSNCDVDLLRELHEQGWGYRKLAAKFEVSKSLVRNIIKGRARGQVASAWRRIPIREAC